MIRMYLRRGIAVLGPGMEVEIVHGLSRSNAESCAAGTNVTCLLSDFCQTGNHVFAYAVMGSGSFHRHTNKVV